MDDELMIASASAAVAQLLSSEKQPEHKADDEDALLLMTLRTQFTEKDKITKFLQRVIPGYRDLDFSNHFHVTRNTLEIILQTFGAHLAHRRKLTGRSRIPTEKIVLVSLWLLAHPTSTYRQASKLFGLGEGNSHKQFMLFCTVIQEHGSHFISWPGSDLKKKTEEFEALRPRHPFPGVIGCVGNTHIRIPTPKENKSSYLNTKGYCSVHLQVICNARLEFSDIFCGWPGETEIADVWARSPIFRKLTKQPISTDYHLLGDSSYPLSTFLMCPYIDKNNVTPKFENFNFKHSLTRVTVEKAIRSLKNRFCKLRNLNMTCLKSIPRVVYAACILHNMCIKYSDNTFLEDNELPIPEEPEEIYTGKVPQQAVQKRLIIATNLMK